MQDIINSEKFQESLKQAAKDHKLAIEDVQKEAEKYIKELYAQQHPAARLVSVRGFNYILSRAYSEKIDVDPKGIKKLMKLMRKHSVAFIMTHKTYLDTLVLISTLARYGMPVPYSFGGINLAFPGLKQLGKSAGIVFIRRSFKDNPIYKIALRHYISTIIDKGDHLTWNIEGTRSRTGKILHPQMGILKYIMDAEKQSSRDVKYVPVSIAYDLIPDVKEMTEQAKGAKKKSENLSEGIKYVRSLGSNYGRAAIRFGNPVEIDETHNVAVPQFEDDTYKRKDTLPFFAFDLINQMSRITPVSTVSLICNVLLNDFALTKKEIEFKVKKLMEYIGKKQEDSLMDRGNPIAVSVQKALNLLQAGHIIRKSRAGQKAQFSVISTEYLSATYYANMVAGHLYHSAFVEMALVKVKDDTSPDRIVHFWEEIMNLRNLFKFEFFYTNKAKFSDEIEAELNRFDKNWREILNDPKRDVSEILKKQDLFISRALLLSYIEANKVVCHTLSHWDENDIFTEEEFLELCIFKGKELHWHSRITRLGSISKPFLSNAYRFAENAGLGITDQKTNHKGLEAWMHQLEDLTARLTYLKEIEVEPSTKSLGLLARQNSLVPEATIPKSRKKIEEAEEGPHIAAYFDLDRTIINDFSAKRFMRTRLFSGETTAKEYITQFMTALVFSFGNRDFEVLTKIAALGVKGIPEKVFADLGQEVFEEYLLPTIYPESRELIKKHFEKGHRVVIISAATPYQTNPVARELGISDVYCTQMELQNGKFTGRIAEMRWGEGKARAARIFARENTIDLSKSYFYSDSFDDYPLFKIVGKPVATNPDNALSQVAFENDWPILRFKEPSEKPVVNGLRTGLAAASIYPSAVRGAVKGLVTLSRQEAANTTFSSIGDFGTRLAGLQISVRGKRNLTDFRPAVFCFNHQSAADFFIIMKLLRRDFTGVAKKELERTPIGPIFKALGAIYIDRSNKTKAIEAMKPAVEALKNGVSVAIAPEGTRSGTAELGPFKKGAFHLAMQAGVPIVPIVIKNAYQAVKKGSMMLRPTHIEVVVLDPVETALWKRKNLNQYIEEVRELFVAELNH
ncbi:HAD-IB family hydrolase [Muricauda sp. SCSIO 64092]|uniref:HAD-IB family hydrolase n=1 Tax=Allomuricauda sp. SCSIO 64092 TaxID=2908842 RepID=UPI001FF496CA|nr:HAD-IB family hydrolase [Muricauda sp. SCSIO 64092]UOY07775.1 HAD-IB family hydrolase [Muricauda sp. SCSIO 64092]